MPTHLYCLLPATTDAVPPASVRVLAIADGLIAWVSDSSSPRLSRDARDAARATVEHDRVVGAALAQGVTPVPALLADPYEADAEATVDVAMRSNEILEALERISGRVEMTAIVAMNDATPAAAPGRGRAYLEQLRSQPSRAAAIADRLAAGLQGVAGQPVRRADGGRVAISHLVGRASVQDYRSRALAFAGDGYRIVIDGPRAPYSFAAYSPRKGFLKDQPASA